MKKVVVLIRQKEQQYEGLRTSLGMLLEQVEVAMVVLDHEVTALAQKAEDEDAYEAYLDNMEFLDEMEGERYSNHPDNVAKHGFKHAELSQVAEMATAADLVIPF
jgi:hypothetical protein